MKNLSIVLIVFIFNVFTLFSQIKVKISGNIFNSTSDSIYISSTQGNKYINHFSVLPDKKGNYVMEGTLPFPDYYQFRLGNQAIHVILKEGTNMQIYGDGSKFMQFHNIVNSDETIKLNEFVSMILLMPIYENFQTNKNK